MDIQFMFIVGRDTGEKPTSSKMLVIINMCCHQSHGHGCYSIDC